MGRDQGPRSDAMAPHVSVVVATFRREQLVSEAIASARAQHGVTAEVVVVDDSPEGSAREVVEAAGSGVRYVHRASPSGGRPGLARNDGVAHCRAPFVHFLDDDDVLAAGALAALRRALSQSEAGVAFGRVVPFGHDAGLVEKENRYFVKVARAARAIRGRRAFAAQLLFLDSLIVNSACMVRREAFDAAGGYDPALRCFEDVDLCLRIGRGRGAVFVDRDVLYYRVGPPSIMRDIRGRARHPSVLEAYQAIHRRYRQHHGELEYRSLQVLARGARRVGLA